MVAICAGCGSYSSYSLLARYLESYSLVLMANHYECVRASQTTDGSTQPAADMTGTLGHYTGIIGPGRGYRQTSRKMCLGAD